MAAQKYRTKQDVLRRGLEAVGIPLRVIDTTDRLRTGKGAVGSVLEEGWFGYMINSGSEPDFAEAGVELKVTPYIRTASGIKAKERLVCNIINYMEEYDKTFFTSSFWHKCSTMLIMSYEHRYGVPKEDYTIDKAVLFSFPEEDLIMIEHDWDIIIQKVRAGRAHEISEGDTLYLGACTKGASAASVREQPFSPIPAKQRAYSLKASYMTQVLNKYIFGAVENPRIIRHWSFLKECTFEEYIIRKVSEFYGRTQDELKNIFNVDSNAKSLNEIILARMLNVTGKIAYTAEFQKAGIIPKTIRVQRNGRVRESMSFPSFDFMQVCNEELWEESELYNYLAPAKFMFVIFQESDDGKYVFDRVVFWNIPNADLDEVGRVWQRTVQTLREGVELYSVPNGIGNNLPKQSESRIAHVRPHGKDSSDKLPLPDGRMMTKQCFWLNNTYIMEQIGKPER